MAEALLPSNQPTTYPMDSNAASTTGGLGDLRMILSSKGPIVKAVRLSASKGLVEGLEVDTTPQAQDVAKILGGPFTFLGQYEDEGIVLMIRRDQDHPGLPVNPHPLQPPFDQTSVKGDILCLRVAPEEGEEAAHKSNEEFFLHYTQGEYLAVAARKDVKAVTPSNSEEVEDTEDAAETSEEEDDEEMEGEDDSEDEEEDGEGGFMALLMGQVLQRFQQEHGRAPDAQELEALQSAIAQKLGSPMEE